MPINTVLGLISALIGSTATLLGAWAYIRSKHPSRKELLHGIIAVTVIMGVILGSAVLLSHATTTPVDSVGKPTSSPVPLFQFPGQPAPSSTTTTTTTTTTPTPTQNPTQQPTSTESHSHSHSSRPTTSSTPILTTSTPPPPSSGPTPASIPTPASTSVSSSIPLSLTPVATK